jgi:DNA replication protein DnaC
MTHSEKHYGLGDPNCPICGGVGYVSYNVPEGDPRFGRVFDCECRRAQVDARQQVHLRRLGGLEYLADKTLDTFDPDLPGLREQQQAELRRAYQRVSTFADDPQGWLIITGGYGCGKTHLAAAIANAQVAAGNKVLFVTAPDLLDHLRSAFGPANGEDRDYDLRFDEVRNTPLLILDDLGIESPTPWAVEKLYQVLNHRYNAQLPTVITTNYSLDELEQRLRSRLYDHTLTSILRITAPDYRTSAGMAPTPNELNALPLYQHLKFDNFDHRRDLPQEERENVRRALAAATSFAENPEGWLVFLGHYGTGKTHLAAAIASAQALTGESVIFVTVPDLLDHLRAAFAPNSLTSYDKRFHEVKTAPLLILDDLGTESATPWVKEKLYQLFSYRYNARLPTVITTAYELEKLDERLVRRMLDRRLSTIVVIGAPAYRGERLR